MVDYWEQRLYNAIGEETEAINDYQELLSLPEVPMWVRAVLTEILKDELAHRDLLVKVVEKIAELTSEGAPEESLVRLIEERTDMGKSLSDVNS